MIATGQIDRAEALAERWRRLHGQGTHYVNLLMSVLIAQGRMREALDLHDQVDEADRSTVWKHNRAALLIDGASEGQLPDRQECLEGAVSTLESLLESDACKPDIFYNLANGLSSLGRLDEARTRYHEYLEAAPPKPEALVNLANAYRESRRFSEAIDLYVRALAIRPDHDMAWANLAAAYDLAHYMSAGKRPHLLVLSEICSQRSESCFDGFSRALEAAGRSREYRRREWSGEPTTDQFLAWNTALALPSSSCERRDFASFYADVIRREHLHLNLFDACPHQRGVLPDRPIVEGISHTPEAEAQAPEWFRILNVIQWEFHSARTEFVLASWQGPEQRVVDSFFTYVDVGDRARLNTRNRHLLQCIASSMNVFDKIAIFLNSFFNLEIPNKDVKFAGGAKHSPLKRLEDISTKGVRENLDALAGMADDLDNSFFRRAKRLRNEFTHRYVVPVSTGSAVSPVTAAGSSCDENTLDSQARNALMLAKAGILHTVAIVMCRDFEIEHGKIVERRPRFPTIGPEEAST